MTKSDDKKKHFPQPSSGTMMAAATLGLLGVTATDAAHGQGGDVLLSLLENVQSFNVLGDGTLSVVLQGGEVMTLPAGSFSVVGGEIMLTAEAAALLQTGVAAGAGAGAGAAANLAGFPSGGYADWQMGGFDAFADLSGEVLSLAPVSPQFTTPDTPTTRAPLPPIDQVWQDDALAATMLHLDLADPIEGF